MELFRFRPGETPVLLSLPHIGTEIPPAIARTMTEAGRAAPDRDRHLDRLLNFAPSLGVGFLAACQARCVVDLDCAPHPVTSQDEADSGGPCPVRSLDNAALYQSGQRPDATEVKRRITGFWQPYHECLAAELDRLRTRYSVAVLLDVHTLPSARLRRSGGDPTDLSVCTINGGSASPQLAWRLLNVLNASERFTVTFNDGSCGGFIVRHYGAPERNVHAVRLDLRQGIYMDETSPFAFRGDLAQVLRPTLERVIQAAIDWAWHHRDGDRHHVVGA